MAWVVVLIASFGVFLQQVKASALTQNQINAIILLLQSFGADQETISKVKSALAGKPVTSPQVMPQDNNPSAQLTTCPNLTRNLYKGVKGQDVSELQVFLKKHGYFTYPEITNYFGGQTAKAVRSFQCDKLNLCNGNENINGFGVVGPKTRSKIKEICTIAQNNNSATGSESEAVTQLATNSQIQQSIQPPNITRNLYLGTKGDDVRLLQIFLKSTGYFNYPEITGYYGNATKQAVQRFQCAVLNICNGNELITGYGVVGPKTREAILNYNRNTVISGRGNKSAVVNKQTNNTSTTYNAGSCSVSGTILANGESRFFYLYDRSTNCDSVKQTRICQNGELSGDPKYTYLTCKTSKISRRSSGSGGSSRGSGRTSSYDSCTFNGRTIEHGNSVTAYKTAAVPYGQTCQSQVRTCNDGVLSGNYNFSVCKSIKSSENHTITLDRDELPNNFVGIMPPRPLYNPWGPFSNVHGDAVIDIYNLGFRTIKFFNGPADDDVNFFNRRAFDVNEDYKAIFHVVDNFFDRIFISIDTYLAAEYKENDNIRQTTGDRNAYATYRLTATDLDFIYRQTKLFAEMLLRRYDGTNKIIFLQNGEADMMIFDPNSTGHCSPYFHKPTDIGLANIKDYWNTRQRAINDARKNVNSTAHIYHVCEVSRVLPSLDAEKGKIITSNNNSCNLNGNTKTVASEVFPKVNCDLYGYTVYENYMDTRDVDGVTVYNNIKNSIEYIKSKTKPSPIFGRNNVMVTEIGLPEHRMFKDTNVQKKLTEAIYKLIVEDKLPAVAFWALYSSNCMEQYQGEACRENGLPLPINTDYSRYIEGTIRILGYWMRKPDATLGDKYSWIVDRLLNKVNVGVVVDNWYTPNVWKVDHKSKEVPIARFKLKGVNGFTHTLDNWIKLMPDGDVSLVNKIIIKDNNQNIIAEYTPNHNESSIILGSGMFVPDNMYVGVSVYVIFSNDRNDWGSYNSGDFLGTYKVEITPDKLPSYASYSSIGKIQSVKHQVK